MFKTIDDFKSAAEFFPAGRIIPQRILKGPRKYKSRVKFECDCWAITTHRGYFIAADARSTGFIFSINHVKNAKFRGSPYFTNGETRWCWNKDITDDAWIRHINNALA